MRLDRLGALGVDRLRVGGLAPSRSRSVPALMYHRLSDDREPAVHPYYRVCTSPARFREHLRCLAEAGYRGVTLTEALGWLGRPSVQSPPSAPHPSAGEKLVAITFDDGYADFLTHGWDALAARGFGATVYVPTGFIADQPMTFKDRPCLTWGEIRELRARGIEFGSHTVNHPKLLDTPWDRIRAELQDSKRSLENQLQQPVGGFCYPYAFPETDRAFTARLRDVLIELGYTHCATTIIGTLAHDTDPFAIPRLPVNSEDDDALLRAKIEGSYDYLGDVQRLTKRFAALIRR